MTPSSSWTTTRRCATAGCTRCWTPCCATPRPARLVLATRTDPPLPLARLRARGQLVDVRAGDLRFTLAEAAAFLARALPAPPAPATVDAVTDATEGWAAGLRLAALALLSHPPVAGEAPALAGRRQTLALDYLLDEVLARQPAAVQDFLLRTAVAERLCAPLCDALLASGADLPPDPGAADAAADGAGQAVLAGVLGANLFLTPLDAPAGPTARGAHRRPRGGRGDRLVPVPPALPRPAAPPAARTPGAGGRAGAPRPRRRLVRGRGDARGGRLPPPGCRG